MPDRPRATWAHLSDAQLLAQCEVDTYRASGPGGQKRNKTSSAVRLRHPPSGLIVIAEESRSQHENRARALKRLRQALYLKLRDDLAPEARAPAALAAHPDYRAARGGDGRLDLGRKDPRFWPTAGVVLDVLQAVEARVSEAAEALGVSTANLIDFLRTALCAISSNMKSRFFAGFQGLAAFWAGLPNPPKGPLLLGPLIFSAVFGVRV